MRILILNWRDRKNPKAGGAEVVTEEIARRLVERGHEVTLFTAAFPGCATEETVNGVSVIRRGSALTVHWHAYRYYSALPRNRFDLVVDEINTIPFFTPLYVRQPRVTFMHQLAREVWWFEAKFPLNLIGFLAEPLYLQPYRREAVITISDSTRRDLVALGMKGPHAVIPEAIEITPLEHLPEKEADPTLIYVGRLVPSKRVHHIVKAFAKVRRDLPSARLWIVGGGPANYRARLQAMCDRYGISDAVTFWGFVSQAEKHHLMSRAHAIAVASIREGWGLIVTEANAMGTPAVVYDVPGLRDSTRHAQTGWVCPQTTPESLYEGMRTLLTDADLYRELQFNAWTWSKDFDWEKTTEAFYESAERMSKLCFR